MQYELGEKFIEHIEAEGGREPADRVQHPGNAIGRLRTGWPPHAAPPARQTGFP